LPFATVLGLTGTATYAVLRSRRDTPYLAMDREQR
jgi:hypothetical protein